MKVLERINKNKEQLAAFQTYNECYNFLFNIADTMQERAELNALDSEEGQGAFRSALAEAIFERGA